MPDSTLSTWDTAEYLKTEEDITAYFEAILEEDDPELVLTAIQNITRAKGLNDLADKTGLDRDVLFTAFSGQGHPEFLTVMKLIKALGLSLKVHKT